jgi:hypothetical protein
MRAAPVVMLPVYMPCLSKGNKDKGSKENIKFGLLEYMTTLLNNITPARIYINPSDIIDTLK